MTPRFKYTEFGPAGPSLLQLTSRGFMCVFCDRFPSSSIMDSEMEFTMEFDDQKRLVCIQVLKEVKEMEKRAVKPACVEDAKNGFIRLVGKNCDRRFKKDWAFDEIRGIVEAKFSQLPVTQTVRWFESAFFELAVDGHLIRCVFDLTHAKAAYF